MDDYQKITYELDEIKNINQQLNDLNIDLTNKITELNNTNEQLKLQLVSKENCYNQIKIELESLKQKIKRIRFNQVIDRYNSKPPLIDTSICQTPQIQLDDVQSNVSQSYGKKMKVKSGNKKSNVNLTYTTSMSNISYTQTGPISPKVPCYIPLTQEQFLQIQSCNQFRTIKQLQYMQQLYVNSPTNSTEFYDQTYDQTCYQNNNVYNEGKLPMVFGQDTVQYFIDSNGNYIPFVNQFNQEYNQEYNQTIEDYNY